MSSRNAKSAAKYRGRFAPSPTGPLHAGSLLCALASYLDARANKGEWLLRIEDLDPPREQAGADQLICSCLLAHGLQWDGEVLYQSSRLGAYAQVIDSLTSAGRTFNCTCRRRDLALSSGPYPGTCRLTPHDDSQASALRLQVDERNIHFEDAIQGPQSETLCNSCGDFIVRRKDGLFSYQLAVSVDDAAQDISHIVRGVDLLDSTTRQIHVLHCLQKQPPSYAHIPVLVDDHGVKLSKQTGALAVDPTHAAQNLCTALRQLGQTVPPGGQADTVESILSFAISHYSIDKIPATTTIAIQ